MTVGFMIQLYGWKKPLSGTYVPYRLEGFGGDSLQPIGVGNGDAFPAWTDQSVRAEDAEFADQHLTHRTGGVGQIGLRDPRHQVWRGRSALSHVQEMVRDALLHGCEGAAGELIHQRGDAMRALL